MSFGLGSCMNSITITITINEGLTCDETSNENRVN